MRPNDVVLPGGRSGNVNHVISGPVFTQERRSFPGERPALDSMPDPSGRAARRSNIVELDACGLDPARVRVRIAVHLDALVDKPAGQEDTLARQASFQVKIVEDHRYAHQMSPGFGSGFSLRRPSRTTFAELSP